MSSKLIYLKALKETIEERLRETEEEKYISEADLVDGKEVSSVIKDVVDLDPDYVSGNDTADTEIKVESSIDVFSRFSPDELNQMREDLKSQIDFKIKSFRNDVERVPDWSYSLNALDTVVNKSNNKAKELSLNSFGLKSKEDRLDFVNQFRELSNLTEESLNRRLDNSKLVLENHSGEKVAKETKKLINDIHNEIILQLRYLWSFLQNRNKEDSYNLIRHTESGSPLDLDSRIQELSNDRSDHVINKLILDMDNIRTEAIKSILNKDSSLLKTDQKEILDQYKSSIKESIQKYRNVISTPNWSNFIDKLDSKIISSANHYIKQTTWGGQVKTLSKVLRDYTTDLDQLMESLQGMLANMGSRKSNYKKIKKIREEQLNQLNETIFYGKNGIYNLSKKLKSSVSERSRLNQKEIFNEIKRNILMLTREVTDLVFDYKKTKDPSWNALLSSLDRLVKDLNHEVLELLENYYQVSYDKWSSNVDLLKSSNSQFNSKLNKKLDFLENLVKSGKPFSWEASVRSLTKEFANKNSRIKKVNDNIRSETFKNWDKALDESTSLSDYKLDESLDTLTPYRFLKELASREDWYNVDKMINGAVKYIGERFSKNVKDESGRIIQDTKSDLVDWAEAYLLPYLVYGYRNAQFKNDLEDEDLEQLRNISRKSQPVVDMFFDQLLTPEARPSKLRKSRSTGEVVNNPNLHGYFFKRLHNEAENFSRVIMSPNGVLINRDSEGNIADTGYDRRDKSARENTLLVSLDRVNRRLEDPQKMNYAYMDKLNVAVNELEGMFEKFSKDFNERMKAEFGARSLPYQWYKFFIADNSDQSAKDKVSVARQNLRKLEPKTPVNEEELNSLYLFDPEVGVVKKTIKDLTNLGRNYIDLSEDSTASFKTVELEKFAAWVLEQQEEIKKTKLIPYIRSSIKSGIQRIALKNPNFIKNLKVKLKAVDPDLDIDDSTFLKNSIYQSLLSIYKDGTLKKLLELSLSEEIPKGHMTKLRSPSKGTKSQELRRLKRLLHSFYVNLLIKVKPDLGEKRIDSMAKRLMMFDNMNIITQLASNLKKGFSKSNPEIMQILKSNLDVKSNFIKFVVNPAREKALKFLTKLIQQEDLDSVLSTIEELTSDKTKGMEVESDLDIEEYQPGFPKLKDFIENDEVFIENESPEIWNDELVVGDNEIKYDRYFKRLKDLQDSFRD